MPFPSSVVALAETLLTARGHVAQVRSSAQSALATMAAGPVNTHFIIRFLSEMSTLEVAVEQWKLVPGINAAATAQWPGYAGTLTDDLTAVSTTAQACIDWVITNFPKDGNGWMLGFQFNANGSLVARNFTVAQTAGLRTAIQAFLNTIT